MIPRSEIVIIIVSYNTRTLLLECLASIFENARELPVEVIIVDNNSEDGSPDAVRELYPQMRVIVNAANLGFGAACNQAIKATESSFILLLNSDARLMPETLRVLYEVVALDEGCGAAGCRLIDGEGRDTVNTRNFLTPFNQAFELAGITKYSSSRRLSRTYHPHTLLKQRDCSIDWIDGACLMLRRAALDDVGLFDEQFFMYSEDEDLCFRLKKRGWTVCYSDEVAAVHHQGGSSRTNRQELLRQFYLSQMLFLSKHQSRSSASLHFCVMVATLLSKRFVRLLTGNRSRNKDLAERLRSLKEAYSLFLSLTENKPEPKSR